jgi:E3 ubiquitin-protein ligase UBR7
LPSGRHQVSQACLGDSDELVQYLRPFAQQGKVVNEADVKAFFEARQEAVRLARRNQ